MDFLGAQDSYNDMRLYHLLTFTLCFRLFRLLGLLALSLEIIAKLRLSIAL